MEYQAVIMAAGRGSRMTDLTHDRPKCLLPICNRPMIWFSLKMLENAGFEDVIVVIHEQFRTEVAAIPSKYGLNIKLDIACLPKNEDFGTADSLRLVKDRIKTDVLVISCDLVCDIPLHNVFDLHRTHQSSVTALFSQSSPEVMSTAVPGPKTKFKQERDLIGLDLQTPRLVFLVSEADLTSENEEELSIRKSVMKHFPQISVQGNLLDAHLYVIKKWVCDYIAENRSFTMLKGEVLPHLVRKQFIKTQRKRNEKELPNADVSVVSLNTTNRDICSFLVDVEEEEKIRSYSVWNDHRGDLRGPYQDHNIRCFAYVAKEGFCLRANSLSNYCELNRQVIKRWNTMFPDEEITPPVSKAQVGTDCLIGETSQLSDKCSIKHSVIGQGCNIGEKVRITNCIIMDNVTIMKETTLQGSILMSNSVVENSCDLKDCIVGHTVHSNCKSTNEVLVDADRLLEI
ncbi:translation initiation factor eIF-2B subunit gamma-like [Daphnia pulicaria]|uniref:translation initiation factor eIF-2B subunit gamma-like n=1 Tax=Daphnia pulicaria TaxID=35523 RepID=UPI001EEBA05D|nr:translation initiation factor eIF-2B subunit gamma-like [Daphnia pulicaria]XP_046654406.1 translation initiation factor eIF-2B subunit gamma-like [Daphnia pulicaria]